MKLIYFRQLIREEIYNVLTEASLKQVKATTHRDTGYKDVLLTLQNVSKSNFKKYLNKIEMLIDKNLLPKYETTTEDASGNPGVLWKMRNWLKRDEDKYFDALKSIGIIVDNSEPVKTISPGDIKTDMDISDFIKKKDFNKWDDIRREIEMMSWEWNKNPKLKLKAAKLLNKFLSDKGYDWQVSDDIKVREYRLIFKIK